MTLDAPLLLDWVSERLMRKKGNEGGKERERGGVHRGRGMREREEGEGKFDEKREALLYRERERVGMKGRTGRESDCFREWVSKGGSVLGVGEV